MTRPFTGWHMLALMIAFFGLVIAVNVLMAREAIATFGGTVVDNSYVASQRFNGWLAAARAQQAVGWRATPSVDGRGRLHLLLVDAQQTRVVGRVAVTARHPLGGLPDRVLTLHSDATGYVAEQPLPSGRWLLRIDATAAGRTAHFEDEVRS